MIAAYYDRGDYHNLYAGSTANGLMPLTDTSWPTWSDGYTTYPSNPLIASRIGTDGRTTRGSIEDYWVQYEHTGPDPYVTGGWTQHQWTDAVGDFMKTSQAEYNNPDGGTSFYNYLDSPNPLTCATLASNNLADRDGTYGRKLFYEARGYTVTDCYNQKTDNNNGGFTYAKFKDEIDAGHPVMLNLAGHSIVGYGYSGNTVYVRDTWDSNPGNVYSMTWGGSYQGMALQSVSIVRLGPAGPVNQAPVAQNQTVTTTEDTAKLITLVANDPDGNPLTYSILAQPTHGSLSVVAGNKVTYTPATNYFGTDSFTFKASDGTLDSNTATVSITVTPVNDAPIAQYQTITTAEDTAKEITLVATDVENSPLTYSILAQPAHGSLSAVSGNKVTYTPAPNYNGADSFTFRANDGTLDSNIATVSITVTSVNEAPVAQDQAVTTDEDIAKEITLLASDANGDPLTYTIVDEPEHGSLSLLNGNKLTYTPDENYNGPDSFTFKASDGISDSNIAEVAITVNPVNDAPIARDLSNIAFAGETIEYPLDAFDIDGDVLVYIIVDEPLHGTYELEGKILKYTPDANFVGTEMITYKVNDGYLDSNIARVTFTVYRRVIRYFLPIIIR